MEKVKTESYQVLETIFAQNGNTYVFDDKTSVNCMGVILKIFQEMGLNPMKTEDLRKGILSLFPIELIHMPDLENQSYIFTPNHVSDFDAILLGLLHPRIRIVAKSGWMNNANLRQFLDLHYDLCGIDRASIQSLRILLTDSINYFKDREENKHYLVFSQGTISDFNHNSPERISSIAQKISMKTDVPIVNLFIEQVSLNHTTRIVFDEPMTLTKKDDFSKIWLERETAMQNSLVPPARMPNLTEKHANNNKPGDPFF